MTQFLMVMLHHRARDEFKLSYYNANRTPFMGADRCEVAEFGVALGCLEWVTDDPGVVSYEGHVHCGDCGLDDLETFVSFELGNQRNRLFFFISLEDDLSFRLLAAGLSIGVLAFGHFVFGKRVLGLSFGV